MNDPIAPASAEAGDRTGTASEPADTSPDFFGRVDLVSARLGGVVLGASDDFFAAKENLIRPEVPVWDAGRYTDRGKWMDGWESRRRRTPGHDWCVIRMAAIGRVEDVVVDTAHFTGNYPEACSIDGWLGSGDPPEDAAWRRLLDRSELCGNQECHFTLAEPARCSHLRLNIHPDGGVARLRAYGVVVPDWESILASTDDVELSSVLHGATVVDCSDRFYGAPENMLLPDAPRGMHDGWETRRRRGPGHDWCIVALGRPGVPHRVEVDTSFFKGNYPDRCSVEVATCEPDEDLRDAVWQPVLPERKLEADRRHTFDLRSAEPATHARLGIYPDGGVARFRVFGAAS